MKKILLLNPPGDKIYIRDFYCSHVSKARYVWHPVDLTVLSGILNSKGYALQVVDAIASRIDHKKCLSLIAGSDIDVIIFLTGAVSWENDFNFLKDVKALKPDIEMVGNGEILLTESEAMLERYPFLDAVLFDFTSFKIIDYLESQKDGTVIDNMIYRSGNRIVKGKYREARGEFSLPLPRLDLFPMDRYTTPTVRRVPFATVIASDGCPFKCRFCLCGELGFKWRNVENTLEELRYIKNLGIKQVRFRDNTFGVPREQVSMLCERMIKERLNLSWTCLSRTDVLDEKSIKIMKDAGCHSIQFGVECADEKILSRYGKAIPLAKTMDIFKLCRRYGISTLAHFILGLPGETEEGILKTIEFAKTLEPDYASFNIAVPRYGTPLRRESIERGMITEDLISLDNSCSYPVFETETLNKEALWKLRNKAIRYFYLRPSYLTKAFFGKRTIYEYKTFFKEGAALLSSIFRNVKDR